MCTGRWLSIDVKSNHFLSDFHLGEWKKCDIRLCYTYLHQKQKALQMQCLLLLAGIYNGSRTQFQNAPVERFGTVTEAFRKA